MQYLLEEIHRSSHADVVLLENRDFCFGPMLEGYESRQICEHWVTDHPGALEGLVDPKGYCELRVALDRVLWKGDLSERVMLEGKTLQSMLMTSQQETDDEHTPASGDTIDDCLMTFAIVTAPPQSLRPVSACSCCCMGAKDKQNESAACRDAAVTGIRPKRHLDVTYRLSGTAILQLGQWSG